jgi:predicted esterase
MRASITGGILLVLAWVALAAPAHAQSRYRAVRDPQSPSDIPYARYFTRDKFGRRITFYLSGDPSKRLPIVVSVLGSGAYSNFMRENGVIYDAHRAAREAFDAKAHIVIVEKPGIAFLEQHGPNGSPNGTSEGASQEFRRENTLPRWVEAVSAALKAARSLPLADNSECLLIGHSEGALVVAMIAAQNPFVTHVASLSGTGPGILYELMIDARKGRLYPSLPHDPDTQAAQLLADVAAIRADPSNTDKTMIGHTALYWSSRFPYSAMEELTKTKARIFLAHGTADQSVDISNFDLLYAHLLAQGKEVTAHRYEGADHGYRFASDPKRDGWSEVYRAVRDWFFK